MSRMNKPKKDRSINVPGSRGCCGCGVCVVACPVKDCITLSLDEDGYYIAAANTDTCINCSLCQDVCYMYLDRYTFKKDTNFFYEDRGVYTAYNKENEVREKSSSGGISTALCKVAIEWGYTIIGAYMDTETLRLRNVVIDEIEDLDQIRGSKYLPSYTVDAFMKIQQGGKFLIIGAPCQIGGLRQMFNQPKFKKVFPSLASSEDILLVEFRCFGHPGYTLFDKYTDYLKTINDSGINSINMREKKPSWFMGGTQVTFKDGTEYRQNNYKDPFFFCFRTGQSIHEACLTCDIYKNKSVADIRLEDAWHFAPSGKDKAFQKGLSQVTLFSEKGEKLFNEANKRYVSTTQVNIDVKNRPWDRITNEGHLMELLRQEDIDLPTVINKFKQHASITQRLRWRWNEFAHTPLGKPIHEALKKYIPRNIKSLFKITLRTS